MPLLVAAPLHLEAAELVHRLRRHPDVAHDRDAGAHEAAHQLGDLDAALELDRLGAALLDQAPGGAHAVLDRRLVAHERHVGRPGGRARTPRDDARV